MVRPSAKAGPSKRAPLPIKVDDETEGEREITLAQSKGKVRAVPKKTGSKSEARKTQDALACRLNHLHSQLFQIWVNVTLDSGRGKRRLLRRQRAKDP